MRAKVAAAVLSVSLLGACSSGSVTDTWEDTYKSMPTQQRAYLCYAVETQPEEAGRILMGRGTFLTEEEADEVVVRLRELCVEEFA